MSFDATAMGPDLASVAASHYSSSNSDYRTAKFDLTSRRIPQAFAWDSHPSSSASETTSSFSSAHSQSTQRTDSSETIGDGTSTGPNAFKLVGASDEAPQVQPSNLALLKFLADEVQNHKKPTRPVITASAQFPFTRLPQPTMIDPTANWQPALPLSMDFVPLLRQPEGTAKRPPAPKARPGVAESRSGRIGTNGTPRPLIVKLKIPKGRRNRKVYDDMIAAEKMNKRKFQEEEDDDDEFVVGRVIEQKLKAQAPVSTRPVRATRQKDASAAMKRQREFEKVVEAIEADAEEQDNMYWGVSKKKRASAKSARGASKPTSSPVQSTPKRAPISRPIRPSKPSEKAIDSDEAPNPAPAKRGRPPKATTGIKKTSGMPASVRKNRAPSGSKSGSRIVETQDVAMQDVAEDIAAQSPASSDLSNVSSFAVSSTASSHPSPEPTEGHLIDAAEQHDLFEGTAMQMTNAQDPRQPASDTASSQLVIYNQTSASMTTAQTVPAPTRKGKSQGSRQPRTSVRRNDAHAPHLAVGFVHNGPAGPVNPAAQQHPRPPFANFDMRLPITGAPSWFGADLVKATSYGDSDHGFVTHVGQNQPDLMALQSTPLSEGPDGNQLPRVEPRAMAEPPVWAAKRQQLCETLPYYNAYQSGVYMSGGIIHGMLIDGESRPNKDVFNPEIIITRCGGGRAVVDANGRRAQAVHQNSNPIGLAFERAKLNKLPIVVIAGSNYRNSEHRGDFLPHRYNVLAHFHVTDVWLELNDSFQTYCCRLEKIELQEQSWWAAEPYVPSIYGSYTQSFKCGICGASSKCLFAQGWVCLNINCTNYFILIDASTGFMATLEDSPYSAAFLSERTPYRGSVALPPLVPALLTEQDMIFYARTGTEEVFTKGIVCPKCRCCSRRTEFKKWTCENTNGCNFSYELPTRALTPLQAQPLLVYEADGRYPFYRGLTRNSTPIGHFNVDEFEIKGVNGMIIGYVRHFKSNDLINALKDGPDDLFREMQEKDFGLKRRPVRQKGHAGEILTSHYASNWGAPYKFVVAQQSKPFDEAPEVIIKALKKMTWAGESSLSADGPAFQQFNELLSIGYMENTRIGYHDDGEKELGPTIATLSLGSQAEMSLRPKRSAPTGIGRALNNQRGTKAEVLKILLNHGDIVIMHGEGVQKFYEHAVTPRGTLRYALTCRTILPERLLNDGERAEAARLAQLPDGHEAWNYDGEKLLTETEYEKQCRKSKQMTTALNRTIDDLLVMLQHSDAYELNQLNGMEEVINAYNTAIASAANSSAARDAASASESIADAEAASAEVNGAAADSDYVMVSPVQSSLVGMNADDDSDRELVNAVNDLAVSSSQS